MRATIVRIALAAIAALTLVACSDVKDPLSPNAQVSKALVSPSPCYSIICQPQPNFVDVAAGGMVTCAVHSTPYLQYFITQSNLYCWGDNSNGMLGVGAGAAPETCTNNVGTNYGTNFKVPCSTKPLPVNALRNFSTVSVGVNHVCALERGSGAAFCWGGNNAGQLGIGSVGTSGANFVPTTPVGSLAFSSISAGNSETCGITTAQDLVCWGNGFGGSPVVVGNGFKGVSVEGALGACAMQTSGQTCAGWRGAYDFLGQGTTARHLCQIQATVTECWGEGTLGQLGDGHVIPVGTSYSVRSSSPVVVAQPPGATATVSFRSVATGYMHSCALSGGDAYCWGHGWFGELGTGTQNSANTPRKVQAPWGVTLSFTKIAVGDGHTCGISGGSVWCWGRNESGQLGLGTTDTWLTYPSYDPTNPYWSPNLGVANPAKVSGT
jgi:alpha-tubulin suppressor-like RCC1 family protein